MNDDAIAYGFFMIVLFLVVATLVVVVVFGPMVNQFNDVANGWISTGQVSEQTVKAVQWNEAAMGLVAIVTLIGVLVFAIVRAVHRKKMAGEDF